jgi:hypothetical protein
LGKRLKRAKIAPLQHRLDKVEQDMKQLLYINDKRYSNQRCEIKGFIAASEDSLIKIKSDFETKVATTDISVVRGLLEESRRQQDKMHAENKQLRETVSAQDTKINSLETQLAALTKMVM